MTAPQEETRLDLRSLLAGLGALLLLISLFLTWYGSDGPLGDGARSGWRSFELLDIVLAGLAAAVLYELASTVPSRRGWPPAAAIAKLAGPIALVLVVVSLIDKPPLFQYLDVELEPGIWLALAGALLMTAGSLLTRVRVAFVVTPREGPAPPTGPDAETRTFPRS